MKHVTFEPAAAAQFADLPERIKSRMTVIVERLGRWPEVSGAKPLRGDLADITEFVRVTIGSSFASRATKSSSSRSATATAFTTEATR